MKIWVRGHDIDVLLAVVGPEVAQGPRHGQEGHLIERSAATDGSRVSYICLRTVLVPLPN